MLHILSFLQKIAKIHEQKVFLDGELCLFHKTITGDHEQKIF